MNSVRCTHCARTQPPAGQVQYWCAYCGTPLPQMLTRWVAHPPPPMPGTAPPTRPAGPRQPYGGPPSYRGGHPRWGFPPVVWKPSAPAVAASVSSPPLSALRIGAFLAWATSVSALCAAAMESWRFVLLLRGRTEVLLASEVDLNDALVAGFGLATVFLALFCALTVIPAVLRAAEFAAAKVGLRQAGSSTKRLLPVVIPGWNLYGAGVLFSQTDGLLQKAAAWDSADEPDGSGASEDESTDQHVMVGRLVPGRLITWWWAMWVVNGILVVVALLRALLSQSLQAAADAVELHIALDISAFAVAVLTALVLRRFTRLIRPPTDISFPGWVVLPSGVRSAVAPEVAQVDKNSASADTGVETELDREHTVGAEQVR